MFLKLFYYIIYIHICFYLEFPLYLYTHWILCLQLDDQVSVDSFLRLLGLEKFAVTFKAEEVCNLWRFLFDCSPLTTPC